MKSTCFISKATSVSQANHSQYSSPVEALNLIVESKFLPAEVNDLNIELHLAVEAKEKLAIILFCGFCRISLLSYHNSNYCPFFTLRHYSNYKTIDSLDILL